jgi:hypothetical protein
MEPISVRRLAILLVVVCCSGFSYAGIPAEIAAITPARMGVDHSGNLWGWNPQDGAIVLATAKGIQRSELPPKTSAADAHAKWGIVSIGSDGQSISIARWDGSKVFQAALPVAASSVAWIDENRVAVAPQYGTGHVQVWDIAAKKIALDIGGRPPIDEHTPGAQYGRATILRYDPKHRELLALDAYSGELTAYSDSGKVLRRTTVRHPKQASTDEWLQNMDKDYKAQKQPFRPLVFSYPTLALASDGTVWLGEESTSTGVTLAGIRRDGRIVRRSVASSCANVRVVSWNSEFIFFGDPLSPRPYCLAMTCSCQATTCTRTCNYMPL